MLRSKARARLPASPARRGNGPLDRCTISVSPMRPAAIGSCLSRHYYVPVRHGIRTSCSAQLTFALTLALSQRERGVKGKMADEPACTYRCAGKRTRQLLLRCPRPLLPARLYLLHPCSRTFRHPWRSQAPYSQKSLPACLPTAHAQVSPVPGSLSAHRPMQADTVGRASSRNKADFEPTVLGGVPVCTMTFP
jgi:hypothetical protein